MKGDEVIIAADDGEVAIGRSCTQQALGKMMHGDVLKDTFGTEGGEYLKVILGRFGVTP